MNDAGIEALACARLLYLRLQSFFALKLSYKEALQTFLMPRITKQLRQQVRDKFAASSSNGI